MSIYHCQRCQEPKDTPLEEVFGESICIMCAIEVTNKRMEELIGGF